jgi:hypothetical protein
MSEDNEQRIERTLNLTDKSLADILTDLDPLPGEEKVSDVAKVIVDVPMSESPDGKLYKYTIFVPKAAMTEMTSGTNSYWEEISQKVLEDIPK